MDAGVHRFGFAGFVVLFVFCFLLALGAQAAARTWVGGTSADWGTAANWNPSDNPPQAGEDVVITNSGAAPILSASTPALASLTISNTTLTFTNWNTVLTASSVFVQNGATLTCPVCDTNVMASNSNRVWIVCTNLIVDASGAINVNGKGFQGAVSQTPPHPWNGEGPGGGTELLAGWYGGGGGYGGAGGNTRENGYYGMGGGSYGVSNAPTDAGSGGGGTYGGNGGGAARIEALGTVDIRGSVMANGNVASNLYGGGGSGGSIYITCRQFTGTANGLITANGGDGAPYSGGGGGGGRIALIYDAVAQTNQAQPRPGVRFSAGQGLASTTSAYPFGYPGGPGTVYFPDTAVFLAEVFPNQLFMGGIVIVPGFTNWAPNSLTMTNCTFEFAARPFYLAVTNDLRISGGNFILHAENATLDCGGNLILTNSGCLTVYSGATNNPTPDYGALVSVTGSVSVGAGSWIYPYSDSLNGGSALFRMSNLTVAAGGGIDAAAKGFSGGTNYWAWVGDRDGHGPGRTVMRDGYSSGAGYGGRGGRVFYGYCDGGLTYGSLSAPVDPGSGAGGEFGGAGGGLVRVEARGTVAVYGLITANGTNGTIYGGGGSGGGINIRCGRFDGSPAGLLTVNGGLGVAGSVGAGSGGGGRIAVLYDPLQQNANPGVIFSALGGPVGGTVNPSGETEDGTIYLTNTLFLSEAMSQFSGLLYAPGFTNWGPANLTVTNCAFTLGAEGFVLTVTNNLTVGAGGRLAIRSSGRIDCRGSLTLTNGGGLNIYAGRTNGVAPDYGALVGVSGVMLVGASSWVKPYSEPTNGGSACFRVGSLNIANGGGFDAGGKGFSGGTNWYAWPGYRDGFGPGRGLNSEGYGSGGAYGGRGGNTYASVAGGSPYGSSNAPVSAGSGSGGSYGGAGGGLIRIESAGPVRLDGALLANGTKFPDYFYGGGGAGGGIFVMCTAFNGGTSAVMRADGADAYNVTYAGGGGGGRIAVWIGAAISRALVDRYDANGQLGALGVAVSGSIPEYSGLTSATNGQYGYLGVFATPGTVVFGKIAFPPGVMIQLL